MSKDYTSLEHAIRNLLTKKHIAEETKKEKKESMTLEQAILEGGHTLEEQTARAISVPQSPSAPSVDWGNLLSSAARRLAGSGPAAGIVAALTPSPAGDGTMTPEIERQFRELQAAGIDPWTGQPVSRSTTPITPTGSSFQAFAAPEPRERPTPSGPRPAPAQPIPTAPPARPTTQPIPANRPAPDVIPFPRPQPPTIPAAVPGGPGITPVPRPESEPANLPGAPDTPVPPAPQAPTRPTPSPAPSEPRPDTTTPPRPAPAPTPGPVRTPGETSPAPVQPAPAVPRPITTPAAPTAPAPLPVPPPPSPAPTPDTTTPGPQRTQPEPSAEPGIVPPPVAAPTPGTRARTDTRSRAGGRTGEGRRRFLPSLGQFLGATQQTQTGVLGTPSSVGTYRHYASAPLSVREENTPESSERYDIENVARPNSRRDKAVRHQEIQKKIIDENKSLAELIRRNVEETRDKKRNNSPIIVNPELKNPEPEV
jgi:hypothetical protein